VRIGPPNSADDKGTMILLVPRSFVLYKRILLIAGDAARDTGRKPDNDYILMNARCYTFEARCIARTRETIVTQIKPLKLT
jgi:hypothetical protein